MSHRTTLFVTSQSFLFIATRNGGIRAAVTVTVRPWLVVDFGVDAGVFPATRAFSGFAGVL